MKDNVTLAREYADGLIASGGILREARYEAYLKGANDALRWRTWPQQRPESDGKYLVVLQNRRTFKTTLCVRTFNGGDWIFSCKNEVCYWMPIPKTPIK